MRGKIMAKRKKYSMNERIRFYVEKRHSTKNKNVFAKYTGYLDVVTGQNIDSSMFKTDEERKQYFKGVDQGNKTFHKMRNIKF